MTSMKGGFKEVSRFAWAEYHAKVWHCFLKSRLSVASEAAHW
jgi:hypothetical protein